jgi:hypothetical protein
MWLARRVLKVYLESINAAHRVWWDERTEEAVAASNSESRFGGCGCASCRFIYGRFTSPTHHSALGIFWTLEYLTCLIALASHLVLSFYSVLFLNGPNNALVGMLLKQGGACPDNPSHPKQILITMWPTSNGE